MKNLKTILMPAVILLLGAGSAYATHYVKPSDATLVQGYAFRDGAKKECIPSSKFCDITGQYVCKGDVGSGEEIMYDLNGTTCPNKLTHTSP